jgi:hypothetical protein
MTRSRLISIRLPAIIESFIAYSLQAAFSYLTASPKPIVQDDITGKFKIVSYTSYAIYSITHHQYKVATAKPETCQRTMQASVVIN